MAKVSSVLVVCFALFGAACGGEGGGSRPIALDMRPLAQVEPSAVESIRLIVTSAQGEVLSDTTVAFVPGQPTVFELRIAPGASYSFTAEALGGDGAVLFRGSATGDVPQSGVVDIAISLQSTTRPDPPTEPTDPTDPPDPTSCVDRDGDGFGISGDDCPQGLVRDCDDSVAAIRPGATEVCDELDNDCDGAIDEEDVCVLPCEDGDGDGFGRLGGRAVPRRARTRL